MQFDEAMVIGQRLLMVHDVW